MLANHLKPSAFDAETPGRASAADNSLISDTAVTASRKTASIDLLPQRSFDLSRRAILAEIEDGLSKIQIRCRTEGLIRVQDDSLNSSSLLAHANIILPKAAHFRITAVPEQGVTIDYRSGADRWWIRCWAAAASYSSAKDWSGDPQISLLAYDEQAPQEMHSLATMAARLPDRAIAERILTVPKWEGPACPKIWFPTLVLSNLIHSVSDNPIVRSLLVAGFELQSGSARIFERGLLDRWPILQAQVRELPRATLAEIYSQLLPFSYDPVFSLAFPRLVEGSAKLHGLFAATLYSRSRLWGVINTIISQGSNEETAESPKARLAALALAALVCRLPAGLTNFSAVGR